MIVAMFPGQGAQAVGMGEGLARESRDVLVGSAFGGAACPELERNVPCFAGPCPVDCVVGEWTPWTNCSAICGDGTSERTREMLVAAAHAGKPCPPQ